MPQPNMSDDDFVAEWRRLGNATEFSRVHGRAVRSVLKRRKRLQEKGLDLPTRAMPGYDSRTPEHNLDTGWTFAPARPLDIHSGSVVIFSDAHYQPGDPSLAHRAMIEVVKAIKPRAVIANGDIFDGGSIGRHPPFGWSQRPTPVQELHACQERLGDVEQAIPRGCDLIFTIGNHDIRWERTLATQADQFRELFGMRLADHFPAWELAWSAPINCGIHPVMVKHRFANGIHAAYNNSTKGGVTMVTGHTHCLEVQISAKHMQRYLSEFTFRANHRERVNGMFDLLVGAL